METDKKEEQHHSADCMSSSARGVRDALDVLNGKWKLQILMALYKGHMRFRQIAKEVDGITDRMLSKELKELEINHLVIRDVIPSFPPTVEYSLSKHGTSLEKVITELSIWGISHRKEIMGR
jgi:DNA-binding HxlR family transcriptional regulator